jgi:hypothetical protein
MLLFIPEDIYEELESEIILLVPDDQDEYGKETLEVFERKSGGTVKLIPRTTHMLHWDKLEVIVETIRGNWSSAKGRTNGTKDTHIFFK